MRVQAVGWKNITTQTPWHICSNPNTTHIVWTLLAMTLYWVAIVADIDDAILQGKLINQQMHIRVPDRMGKFYGSREDVAFLLNVPLYSTKQFVKCLSLALVRDMKDRSYMQSRVDPYL